MWLVCETKCKIFHLNTCFDWLQNLLFPFSILYNFYRSPEKLTCKTSKSELKAEISDSFRDSELPVVNTGDFSKCFI